MPHPPEDFAYWGLLAFAQAAVVYLAFLGRKGWKS